VVTVTLWWLLGGITLTAVFAIAFRSRAARLIRLMRALATDPRLPRPVRWLFRVALVIRLIPGPDLGIDEALLILGALLLAGPYRATWKAIRAETR
jgi:hypothetical protein